MTNFEDFGLSKDLNTSLAAMKFTTPTPIQNKAIPIALQGHDILGSAQTGTGKTAAFSIPLIESLLRNPTGTALVLLPTRELAKQVLDAIYQLLGRGSPIKTAFIIGGAPYAKQLSQLRANPRIIVGTPGRINDHLEKGVLNLKNTGFLVLDETDRMLDMGFGVQLDRIVTFLPKKRQTLMFSATLPEGIIRLSAKYLTDPKRISVGETNVVAPKIKQEVLRVEQPNKYNELLTQLETRQGSVIVFVKTKHGADKMAKRLRQDGFTSEALHGDLKQNKRDKVMRNFRDKNFRVLIATDIAARGLDVPHIEHVINFDLPQVAEDYIHRMGRTARAGAEGAAISFVASHDGRQWHAIECLLDPSKKTEKYDHKPKNRKNKSRNGPYRGRPQRDDNRSDKRGGKFEKYNKPSGGEKKGENKNSKYVKTRRADDGESQNTNSKPSGNKNFEMGPGGKSHRRNWKHSDNNTESRGKDFQSRDGENKSGDKKNFGDKKFGEKKFGKSDGGFRGNKGSGKKFGSSSEGGNRKTFQASKPQGGKPNAKPSAKPTGNNKSQNSKPGKFRKRVA